MVASRRRLGGIAPARLPPKAGQRRDGAMETDFEQIGEKFGAFEYTKDAPPHVWQSSALHAGRRREASLCARRVFQFRPPDVLGGAMPRTKGLRWLGAPCRTVRESKSFARPAGVYGAPAASARLRPHPPHLSCAAIRNGPPLQNSALPIVS